jgi:iron complex outermembrane receptor protein
MNQKIGDLNVAGAEYRNENYSISAGQPESYNLYDINGNVALQSNPCQSDRN